MRGHHGPKQSYILIIEPTRIEIQAADEAGLRYGLVTLEQWMHLAADGSTEALRLPCGHIEDWPDFEHRSVMLDISRDKVPRMATLFALVDRLASWKINQLQLYTEHTFAYSGHETVWSGWSPLSAQDIQQLDRYCRDRFIELVPNQNSFGHMHRWLVHDAYRSLAECPEGIDHPFSPDREPFSLCATDPKSLRLLEDLYDQLLPNFGSRLFNVGLDETFDLGLGRSRAMCETKGREEVYLSFLNKVHRLVASRDHRMLFWADIILERPDLVRRLPADVVPLIWGYTADHPFEAQCELIADSGLEFYVCPGTSSWNSFAGRIENATKNLAAAAIHGKRHGASGYMIADWGDNGHLQPLPVSYPGLLTGACYSWNVATTDSDLELASRLDRHAFDGVGLGKISVALGNLYLAAGKTWPNSSPFFHLLVFAGDSLEKRHLDDLDPANLTHARELLEQSQAALYELAQNEPEARLVAKELGWVCRALSLAIRLGLERLKVLPQPDLSAISAKQRRVFAVELEALIDSHAEIWLARNRDGGLAHSRAYLERVRKLLG